MRGTPHPAPTWMFFRGIIPADAGNTPNGSCSQSHTWDHPRGCGEHTLTLCRPDFELGSSPRMRGTRSRICWSRCFRGIIPADAGNTEHGFIYIDRPKDHPRGCGEHGHIRRSGSLRGGSSPRMRGTHKGLPLDDIYKGIIPADAGNTIVLFMLICPGRDHSRGCGEHPLFLLRGSHQSGSSPRMRGTHVLFEHEYMAMRIIPADAGNTPCNTG